MINNDAVLTLGVIVLAAVLFIWQLLPVELTAMVVMSLLLLLGLVTADEAVAGFSNPATITVASMFVLSGALRKSGGLKALTHWMIAWSARPKVFLGMTILILGLLSAFINNTGVVALFLPVMLTVAREQAIAPSKLLIPLSYASQAGGVCSLLGSSTNLLANSIFVAAGYSSLSLFEMGELGIVLLVAVAFYFLLFSGILLPERPSPPLMEAYQLNDYFTEVRVLEKSSLIGLSLKVSGFEKKSGMTVVNVLRDDKPLRGWPYEKIQAEDLLLVEGKLDDILALKSSYLLEVEPQFKMSESLLQGEELLLSEVMIAPGGRIHKHTLSSWSFQSRYNLIVLAIRRKERTFHEKLNTIKLMSGDLLLVQGIQEDIAALNEDDNFILLQDIPAEAFDRGRALRALGIIFLVIALASFRIFPIMISAILGCVLALLTRCLRLRDAYRSIDWSVIFLLVGMLPLSVALTHSGLAQAIGMKIIDITGQWGPLATLAALYGLTALLTEVMTNNAAVAVFVPIALSGASALGVDPKPMVLAVTFAASTSFMTPVGYQTNAMIFSPGGYHYTDFLKAGLPLNVLFLIISVVLIPLLWPF